MDRLLYIHPVGLEGADMQQRSDVARSLGFDVIAVPNEPFFASEIEEELATYVVKPECAGVWADVEADQLLTPARKLLFIADEAEKPLLGRQRAAAEIMKNLVAIIGLPTPEGPNLGLCDDDLDDSHMPYNIGSMKDDTGSPKNDGEEQ